MVNVWVGLSVLLLMCYFVLFLPFFSVSVYKESKAREDNHSDSPAGEQNEEQETHINNSSSSNSMFRLLHSWSMTEIKEELKALMVIAVPVLFSTLFLYLKSLTSMWFMGHLGGLELAGGTLSIAFANLTAFSVMRGLVNGMESICSQAYGARRFTVLSQTCQKTVCLLLCYTIPISFIWLKADHILLLMDQDPKVTSMAKFYLLYTLPDLFAQALYLPLRSFIKTQGSAMPVTYAVIFASLLHFPINSLLVDHLDLGMKGVALASNIHSWILILVLVGYLLWSGRALKPWSGASLEVMFQGWWQLLTLCSTSALTVCLEWWWYELMQILSGLLVQPQASVAAMGILTQATGLIYSFHHAVSAGLTTRVGHELGANRPARAKFATIIGLSVAVLCGLLAVAFTSAVRNVWGKIFSSEEQTLALTSLALPVLGLCELGNAPQTVAGGVLTGTARPMIGAGIYFGSYYLIALPIAALMGLVLKKGFQWLWLGLAAAEASCAVLMMFALIKTDWKHQAERAQELTSDRADDLETSLLQ